MAAADIAGVAGVARVAHPRTRFCDAEERLAALARAGGPLRRVMAALAARWTDRQGWTRLGYARLGDHARERLGLSARSVQELARVGRRLAELPRLEAALVSGSLPWSKLRLLARFVSAEDEARWIASARRVPVRELERALRAVDRGALEAGTLAAEEDESDGEPLERLCLRAPTRVCLEWQRVREYASRVTGERLPAGAVLEMVTAETLSALPLGAGAAGEAEPAEGMSWRDASDERPVSGGGGWGSGQRVRAQRGGSRPPAPTRHPGDPQPRARRRPLPRPAKRLP